VLAISGSSKTVSENKLNRLNSIAWMSVAWEIVSSLEK
jgi:hypothetical protein